MHFLQEAAQQSFIMEKSLRADEMMKVPLLSFSLLFLSFLFSSLAGSVSSLLLLTSHPAQFPEQFGLSYSAAL